MNVPQPRTIPERTTRCVCRTAFSPAFTLVELLLVIAVIAVLMALLVPAFTNLGRAGDITKATYDLSGALQAARSYATSNDTYVWVGFYEEDGSQSSKNPSVPGTGRIIITTVASKDGTNIFSTGTMAAQPFQLSNLVKINNMHLKTATTGDPVFTLPTGTPAPVSTGPAFDTRPSVSGTVAQIGDTTPSAIAAAYQLLYPVGSTTATAQYTFGKVLQFNPRGEASLNNSALTPVLEIGLQSTHGSVTDTVNRNVAAVQITGIGGNVTIYRR